jgi:hypothetical protein
VGVLPLLDLSHCSWRAGAACETLRVDGELRRTLDFDGRVLLLDFVLGYTSK